MPAAQNHLLEQLPRRDRDPLLAACVCVPLTLGEELYASGEPTRHVYFPTQGFISLVATLETHQGLEVGMVGREGMLGAHLALGVADSPLRALVQGPGSALRLAVAPLRKAMAQSPALRRELHRYVYVLMAQMASSATCLRFHLIGQRLARWMLMSHDRARDDHFHVTHEFLAYMLGVRRAGVTLAASRLQERGLIRYHRGEVSVVDRAGLEAAACGCYAAQQRAYAQHLG